MLLRGSGEVSGDAIDVQAATSDEASGVQHGPVLTSFAAAVFEGADDLDQRRAAVLDALGRAGLVDACGVIANFNMMVRIADATGIPLDRGLDLSTRALRKDLALGELDSAKGKAGGGGVSDALARPLERVASIGLKLLAAAGRRH